MSYFTDAVRFVDYEEFIPEVRYRRNSLVLVIASCFRRPGEGFRRAPSSQEFGMRVSHASNASSVKSGLMRSDSGIALSGQFELVTARDDHAPLQRG